MTTDDRAALEAQTSRRVFDAIHAEHGDLPVSVVAGAVMRVAVLVAFEFLGPDRAPDACRIALENILQQLQSDPRRSKQ